MSVKIFQKLVHFWSCNNILYFNANFKMCNISASQSLYYAVFSSTGNGPCKKRLKNQVSIVNCNKITVQNMLRESLHFLLKSPLSSGFLLPLCSATHLPASALGYPFFHWSSEMTSLSGHQTYLSHDFAYRPLVHRITPDLVTGSTFTI